MIDILLILRGFFELVKTFTNYFRSVCHVVARHGRFRLPRFAPTCRIKHRKARKSGVDLQFPPRFVRYLLLFFGNLVEQIPAASLIRDFQ